MLPDMYEDAKEELLSWIESELLLTESVFGKYRDLIMSKDLSRCKFISFLGSSFCFISVLSIIEIDHIRFHIK